LPASLSPLAGTSGPTEKPLGGILTYAVEAGIIENNPAHGIRKPKDNVRNRRLTADDRPVRNSPGGGDQAGRLP
jgi:hypothetical protein